jgi:hypothetical protein
MADPLGFHVSLRLEGSRNLTPTVAARREFGRCVLTIARPFDLLACRWVDTHGHLEIMGSREEAGELTRRVEIGLQQRLKPGGRFQPAHFEPMHSMGHVRSTFFYIVGQLTRHGVDADRFHDASNVPDIIGARRVGGRTAMVVKRHMPRTKRQEILEAAGLVDPEPYEPQPFGLADAAAAAIGRAALAGHADDVVDARIAAVRFTAGLSTAWIATELAISVRTVHRLRSAEPDPALMRAIRQQLAMRQRG